MKYLKTYKLFESIRYSDAIADIEDLLLEIGDKEGYITSVTEHDDHIIIRIDNESSINLDEISDNLIHLYDYMKEHQHLFKRRPETAHIRTLGGRLKVIGWAQVDKRTQSAYKSLVDNDSGLTMLQFKWNKANPVIESTNYSDMAEEKKEDARDYFYDLMDMGFAVNSSRGSVIDDGMNKFIIQTIQISKSEAYPRRAFIFSEIIDTVDYFMDYVKEIESDKEKSYVRVVYYNYEEDKQMEQKFGKFNNWETTKKNIREEIGLASLVTRVSIYYRVDLK